MRLSAFIENNLETILEEWVAFARTLLPARAMSDLALRDHVKDILLAIAQDMKTSQTEQERSAKSKRLLQHPQPPSAPETAAAAHGAVRQISGFDIQQLVAEYRALRASVLALWHRSDAAATGDTAQEEIARFHEAIDEALSESVERYATDIAKSRDMFLAVLGHDVRGPLSGIKMATDVLVMPTLTEPVRLQVAMRIRRASNVIDRLTSDLLEYTRSRLGRGIPVEPTRSDLQAICEEALDAVRGAHPGQNFVGQFGGDMRTDCDSARMQQALGNLLNNAVQHGDPSLPVVLDGLRDAEAVILKVSNFGCPIPADALQVIFEPLVQVPSSPSEPHERPRTSLGLGLFIVQEIVQGHGGTISVTSSAEAGTVFTIRLPHNARDRERSSAAGGDPGVSLR